MLCNLYSIEMLNQWRIQDFPQGGAPTLKIAIIFQIFAENCMKMKEFGPRGGGALAPPLGSANAECLSGVSFPQGMNADSSIDKAT